MNIWSASVLLAVMHWLFRKCFPRSYAKFREAKRLAEEEERAKAVQKQRERDRDVEASMEGEGETPLRS